MYKLVLFLFPIFLFPGFRALSFSCGGVPSFCEVFPGSSNLIVTGVIEEENTNNISFRIIRVLKGNSPNQTITIWDTKYLVPNDLDSTLHKANELGLPGDTLILELPKITQKEQSWDIINDYRLNKINLCELAPIKVEEGIVKGYLKGINSMPESMKVHSMGYEEFNAAIENGTISCSMITGLTREQAEFESSLNLYPVPVSENLTIEGDQIKEVKFYTIGGRLVLSSEKGINLDVSTLETGMYIAEISNTNGVRVYKKILKK